MSGTTASAIAAAAVWYAALYATGRGKFAADRVQNGSVDGCIPGVITLCSRKQRQFNRGCGGTIEYVSAIPRARFGRGAMQILLPPQ